MKVEMTSAPCASRDAEAARVIVVGAGPAGVRAAQALVAGGLRPLVIDENRRAGGQIYRQPPPGFVRDPKTLYGFEATRAQRVHAAFTALLPSIDYLPDTLVWHGAQDSLELLIGQSDMAARSALPATFETTASPALSGLHTQRFSHIVLCTGALDRTLPFPGWTLPGVYTLGAAQVALKSQGCGIGERVVLAGAGPLLYLVAYQYAKAGAQVVAVLDIATPAQRRSALPDLLRQPAVLAKGVYFLSWLRMHRIPVYDGVTALEAFAASGADASAGPAHARIGGVRWRDARGRQHQRECDALATGFGLRSETQLADLLGCRFDFDVLNQQWLPFRDAACRSSLPGVYLAGDGSGIAGADAAERAGERAGLAVLEDLGQASDVARAAVLSAELERIGQFRRGLEKAFPVPYHWARNAPDDLVVCRCEEVRAGDIRAAVKQGGAVEMNRVKALCRAGMGRCQGRICSTAAAEIVAQESGLPLAEVGRWRAQPPLKPLPAQALAALLARESLQDSLQPGSQDKPLVAEGL